MKIIHIRVISVLLMAIVLFLLAVEFYLSSGGYTAQSLYAVSSHDIFQESGQELSYHHKKTDESFYEHYTFRIMKDSIITNDDQVYMFIHQPSNQTIDIYLNQNKILGSNSSFSLNGMSPQDILLIPIKKDELMDINVFELELGSRYSIGIYGDIIFVDESIARQIEFLIMIDHNLRCFIFYSSIMLCIGFFLFSKIVIQFEDETRAKTYQFITFGILLFIFHSFSVVQGHTTEHNLVVKIFFEGFLFMTSMSFILYAIYTRSKSSLIKIVFIFQAAFIISSISLLVLFPELYNFIHILNFFVLLLTYLASYLYNNAIHDSLIENKNIRGIIYIIIFTQFLESLNQYFIIIPKNNIEILSKVIPIVIAITLFIDIVFSELLLIRKKNDEEQAKLKNLNTNIYEYVSEGVFSISENLLVNDMYTKVCRNIFETDLSGMNVARILADKETPVLFIERLLNDLFNNKIPWPAGIELLPAVLNLHNRYYALTYQKVSQLGKLIEIIVRVSDITEREALETQIVLERDKLTMSITSIMNREELLPLVNEFISFMDSFEFDSEEENDLLNIIHTYKGNFGVFNFIHIVNALHDFETKLINKKRISPVETTLIIEELYKDLEIITEVTGSSFFEDTLYLKANINNLETVYNEVKKYFYNTEASLIIFIIKKIFNKSIRDSILFYGREVRKKAMELGKEIKTIDVTGDEVFVDYNYYKSAIRSLVHIFNNCLDHGIEETEERLILGKPKFGEISCRINDFGNFFEIVIKDDGRGIDVERLAERLITAKIISSEDLDHLTEEEILDYVFSGEVSTLDEASLTSGRGVGLSSVKNEVEKVGGEIRIISFIDFGTEVKILLPKENEALISYFSLPLLMDLYVEAFKIYVKSNNIFELPLNIIGSDKFSKLYEYNVKIKFEGPESGHFFMSCNKNVLWKLACYLTENPNLTESEFNEIALEVIRETCNIVAGNSTSIFDLNQKYINIMSPDIIDADYFDKGNLVYTWHMLYADYAIVLGLILE